MAAGAARRDCFRSDEQPLHSNHVGSEHEPLQQQQPNPFPELGETVYRAVPAASHTETGLCVNSLDPPTFISAPSLTITRGVFDEGFNVRWLYVEQMFVFEAWEMEVLMSSR